MLRQIVVGVAIVAASGVARTHDSSRKVEALSAACGRNVPTTACTQIGATIDKMDAARCADAVKVLRLALTQGNFELRPQPVGMSEVESRQIWNGTKWIIALYPNGSVEAYLPTTLAHAAYDILNHGPDAPDGMDASAMAKQCINRG